MQLKIMKFGGTSVATEASRVLLIAKVKQAVDEGYKVVLVVSAMGRLGQPYATDTLLSILPEGVKEDAIERDLLMSCGETISAALVSALLNQVGVSSVPLMGFQAGINTDQVHGDANVLTVDKTRILGLLENIDAVVVTGFQGISPQGFITTLGRGGSDYTASVLGVHLDATIIEIYTDVDGVMTADPRVVKDAKVLKHITHSEVYQMAVDGAKVVDHKAVELAMRANKPLVIKNTFSDEEGTIIQDIIYDQTGEFIESGSVFTAITAKKDMVLVKAYLSPDQGALTEQMMLGLDARGIATDMINFFTTKKLFVIMEKHQDVAEALFNSLGIQFDIVPKLAKVTAVGANVRYVPDIMKSVMRALMLDDIEVFQTIKTDSTVGCLVAGSAANEVVNVLHRYYKPGN